MMIAVAFFAAAAILCCASADSVTTSLLIPDFFFVTDDSFQPPTFVGQVTVTRSTTYYILDRNTGGAVTYFDSEDESGSGSYTFSEISASTQYPFDLFAESTVGTGSSVTNEGEQTSSWTVNCNPLSTSSSALCTTIAPNDDETTNIESSLYSVIFTTEAGYSAASSTTATSAATARSTAPSSAKPSSTTTTHPTLDPSAKIGIGLGVPLGTCALAGLALLLYRHGKHKERSRKSQMGNLATPGGFNSAAEGKKLTDAGAAGQTFGRQPPVYSMEMQG